MINVLSKIGLSQIKLKSTFGKKLQENWLYFLMWFFGMYRAYRMYPNLRFNHYFQKGNLPLLLWHLAESTIYISLVYTFKSMKSGSSLSKFFKGLVVLGSLYTIFYEFANRRYKEL